MSVRLKKNDRVKVISGKDKGKEGKIIRRVPERDLVVVEGVNVRKKHNKPFIWQGVPLKQTHRPESKNCLHSLNASPISL